MDKGLLFFVGIASTVYGLTLDGWKKHSMSIPEFPSLHTTTMNWFDPDYSDFLKTMRPSLFKQILQRFGIKGNEWSPLFFKNIITEIANKRLICKNDFNTIGLLTVNQPTHIFVWGDTHAAFHSLLRGLSYLYQENVINEMGKILDKNNYFIFHGDQISRGAYSMETLSLIAQILLENPEHALYIKGNHESDQYWHNFGLKRELRIRASYLESSFIPCNKIIEDFFSTLSTALCVNNIKQPDQYVMFCFNGADGPYLKKFIHSDQTTLRFEHHDDFTNFTPKEGAVIECLIKTEEWMKQHRAKQGLALLDQTFGATTWAVLSSPIEVHRKYYNLHNDAFIKVSIDPENIRKTTISLYAHDLEDQTSSFKVIESYNAITARPLTSNIPDPVGDDIVIGSNLSLVQGIPIMGERVKTGISVAINAQNRNGGINGRHIRFFPLNDDYTQYKTLENIEFYLNNGITDILIASTGSPTLEASIEYLKNKKIVTIGPITGDVVFLDPTLKGLINVTGSYDTEIETHLNTLIKDHAVKKFAFFYQIEGLSNVMKLIRKILPQHGITQWLEIPYTKGTINFQKEAQKLKSAQIDAVGILGISQAGQSFIREVGLEFLSTKALFGHSFLGDESFHQFIKQKGLVIELSRRVPNPLTSTIAIVEQYRVAMTENDELFGADSLEGYIVARLVIDLMLQCGPTINKDTIIAQAESLINFEWHGLKFNFDPAKRTLLKTIWLEIPSQEPMEFN